MIMCRRVMVILLMAISLTGRAATDVRTPENRVIYEVFVRNFSPAGNLKGVEAQIPRLKELGVDVVWLMPVYKLGDIGKWGTYSSPYAVKDYKALDPANGTEQDLRDLVNTIHANGMEIWFDWVANHTSMDHVWVSGHPEYYKRSGGNFVHPNGWNDVYQLDVNNTAMQAEMINCMKYWVDNFDIDGYRCDYASGPSPELWRKASQQVLKNGQRIAWLAEDDSRPELVRNGYFDYNYAWGFRDRLVEFARGGSLDNLKNACMSLHTDMNYLGRSRMVYLSNHDVVQDNGGTEDKHFGQYLRPMTVLEFTIYGMPLLYNGQEIQYKSGQVLLSEKTPINWNNPDTEMTSLIKTLCWLKHTQPALNTGAENGTLINHNASNSRVYVYERRREGNSVVVMLNLGNTDANFTISGSLPDMQAREVFTDSSVRIKAGESFSLPAYGYAVYIPDENSGEIPIIPQDPVCNIYVDDQTGWSDLYLYSYRNDAPSFCGLWPGVALRQTETIGNVTYKVMRNVPIDSHEHHLILHNGAGTQYDVDGTFIPDSDIFIMATPTGGRSSVDSVLDGAGDSDTPPQVYYNLQGVLVDRHATPGVYIRRQGNRVSKIKI